MKKRFLFGALCLLAAGAQAQHDVRLMTYNIKNGLGMDNVRNVQRIANVINNAAPDVVAVQEVDSVTNRSGRTYVLGEIAERTQMHAYFAPAINYDGGKYGIGMLSRQKPLRVECGHLPGREEERAFLLVEFDDYIYCCTHLSLTEEDRIASLPLIRKFAEGVDKPFFLAGDFNAFPESEFIAKLKKDFNILSDVKQFTFPSPAPEGTIDYVVGLKNPAFRYSVNSTQVLNEPVASDHRPILTEVRLAQKADKIISTPPYLQNPLEGGITIMCETSVPAYTWVEYGTDRNHLQKVRPLVDGQVVCNGTLHKIRLEGLQPGVTYYYRVCSQEILQYQGYHKEFGHTAVTELASFTLPDTKGDCFTALVFNDLHKHSATFRALCDAVSGVNYDFVVFNGDCVDDPANRREASAFIRELTMGVKADRVPVFFMRGNHEIRNAYSIGLREHYDYVGDKTYGAFNWGDTRIVMLDCGEDKPDDHWVYYGLNDFSQLRKDQVAFLKEELASKQFKKASKRILMHHIPLYGNDGKNLCAELWTPVLKKAPFDVSINAHTHSFAYHPVGEKGNPYPVIIGGGFKMDEATVMVVSKKGDSLTVKVLNTKGKVLLNEKF